LKRWALPAARLFYLLRVLGPVGWGGIFLVLGSVLLLLGGSLRLGAQERDERLSIDRLEQRIRQGSDPVRVAAARDPVEALLLFLPPAGAAPDFIRDLERRAARSGVRIDRTEYRVHSILGNNAQRYQVSFPAHAAYPQVRTLLEGLLHDYPSLALDEISFRREAEGGEQLEARVSLSLYLRREG